MTKTINFHSLFSICSHESQNELLHKLLNTSSPIRKKIIDFAKMSDQEWSYVKELISIDGESFTLGSDQEKDSLKISPGDIDYNVFYQDGSTYQEPIKASILLDCLRENFVYSDPAYSF
jgi:hypothetical protein